MVTRGEAFCAVWEQREKGCFGFQISTQAWFPGILTVEVGDRKLIHGWNWPVPKSMIVEQSSHGNLSQGPSEGLQGCEGRSRQREECAPGKSGQRDQYMWAVKRAPWQVLGVGVGRVGLPRPRSEDGCAWKSWAAMGSGKKGMHHCFGEMTLLCGEGLVREKTRTSVKDNCFVSDHGLGLGTWTEPNRPNQYRVES